MVRRPWYLASSIDDHIQPPRSIADVDGPNVAENFYESLMTKRMGKQQEGQAFLNTKKGARALHEAVIKLRSDGVPLERWVPFIYLGR